MRHNVMTTSVKGNNQMLKPLSKKTVIPDSLNQRQAGIGGGSNVLKTAPSTA